MFSAVAARLKSVLVARHLKNSTNNNIQKRCKGGGKRTRWQPKSEEYHIKQALMWMKDTKPGVTVLVENACFTGFNFLPGLARRVIFESNIRVKVLTHADRMSDKALAHQIAIAEEDGERDGCQIAVFALHLKEETKPKEVRKVQDCLSGACKLNGRNTVMVCGVPNAGKSSLILPLTKTRTLTIKKKRHYHLPKISSKAGRTLGLKKHVLDSPQVGMISLVDSPGLRPKLEDVDERAACLLLAAGVLEPWKGLNEMVQEQLFLDILLGALNRHGELSGTLPYYCGKFGLEKPLESGLEFLDVVRKYDATHIGDYKDLAIGKGGKRSVKGLQLIKRCHKGDYGGMVFGQGIPIKQDVPQLRFNRSTCITYMNEQAKKLVMLGTGGVVNPSK